MLRSLGRLLSMGYYSLVSHVPILSVVTLDSHLGKISDYFHYNNKNNQLKRKVWPPEMFLRCPVMNLSIPLEY